jgi:beta-carotene hydroxylase
LSIFKLSLTISLPFLFFGLYFFFALHSYWITAIGCTIALSFTTYGSTSHDLVHGNLRISKTLNEIFLSFIELICFRSGHAYKVAHLFHHKRYPNDDDIEGAASRMTFFKSLLEGIVFQFKIYRWSLKQDVSKSIKRLILAEGILVIVLEGLCMYSLTETPVYFTYLCLMIMGSWIIPLVTSYAVHTPEGIDELHQTRLFRGWFFRIIAFEHLYHLEHHLYPMVPHKNWKKLADRLDFYFQRKKIKPILFKFHKMRNE